MALLDRVTRRRLVLGLLLVASLALLTVYFREPDVGRLHGVQNSLSGAAVPAEDAVQRVAQPFRDAWSWSRDLVNAKSERDRLRHENEQLRVKLALATTAVADHADELQLINFVHSPQAAENLRGWRPIGAQVAVRSPAVYSSKVIIDAGGANGVHKHDPVITGPGWLVGQVTDVTAHSATVTLINDGSAAEGATVLGRPGTRGLVTPSSGDHNTLLLNYVPKAREVKTNDTVVTQGWRAMDDQYRSIYPPGLIVGAVSSVTTPETSLQQNIQVTPYADLGSFHTVVVLDPGAAGRSAP